MSLNIEGLNLGNYIVPQDARGGICVDIGGNIGSFSHKYKDYFNKIYCYEPVTELYEICKKRLEDSYNIEVYKEAIWRNSKETLNIIRHKSNCSGSTAISSDSLNDEWDRDDIYETCLSISIDDVICRAGSYIDYLKIDCECGEYEALINKDLSRIKFIGIELHWQMGADKNHELLRHLDKTHIISFDELPSFERNSEMFCARR